MIKTNSLNQQFFSLISKDKLTHLINSLGISNWSELLSHVQSLPYGRNTNRTDLSLVITEQKGTCSSKHALLKQIAHLNKIPDVTLILGMYKMNSSNTPGIGSILIEQEIEYIPEAHCYLKISDNRLDLTSKKSTFRKIEQDLISEIEILPHQIAQFKVDYHKNFIKNWIQQNQIRPSFDEVWMIREKCIENISNNDNKTL